MTRDAAEVHAIVKHLNKAQAEIVIAIRSAELRKDIGLAKQLHEQNRQLGATISSLRGGPVVLSAMEIVGRA